MSKEKINEKAQNILVVYGYTKLEKTDLINRAIFAVLLDEIINPFDLRDVDHFGDFIEISTE